MHYNDHDPPHFHAIYGGQQAQVDFVSMQLVGGQLPRRATRLVFEWAALHSEELAENWRLRVQRRPLKAIEPLE